MATPKSLTPAEVERVLAHIATSANAERNRAMFLMGLLSVSYTHLTLPTIYSV